MTTVRELLVSIGVDVDERQLEQVNHGFDAIGRAATVAAGIATAAFGAVAASLWQVVDAGSEAVDGAARLGITAEQYQELAYAAEQMGSNIGSIGPAVNVLARQLSALREGNEEVAASFAEVGLSAESVQGMNTVDLLQAIADRASQIEDPMQRAALMQRLLGRGALALAPMLAAGGDEMRALREEARSFGIVLDNETAAAAESFGDDVTRVKSVLRGFVFQIGSQVLPLVQENATAFLEWASANRELIQQRLAVWLNRAVVMFRAIYRAASAIIRVFGFIGAALGGMEHAIILVSVALASMVTVSTLQALWSAVSVLASLARGLNVAATLAALAKLQVVAFYAAVAAIGVALYVAYEQLSAFFSGQDSFLTRWVDRWDDSTDTIFGKVARFLADIRDYQEQIIGQMVAELRYYGNVLSETWGSIRGGEDRTMYLAEQFRSERGLTTQQFNEMVNTREGAAQFQAWAESANTFEASMARAEEARRREVNAVLNAPYIRELNARVDQIASSTYGAAMAVNPFARQPAQITVEAPVTVEVPPGMMSPEGIGAAVQQGMRDAFDSAMLDALDADVED